MPANIPLADCSDADVVSRVVATRDQLAFAELVRRYQGMVRSLLVRLCRDASRADDLAQDTFVRAFEKIDQVDPARVRPWLGRIAYRQFLQWHRSHRRYGEVVDLWSQGAEREVSGEQDLDLDRYLAVLSESEREAVILCFGFGMTHVETAEALGRPLGTVKSQVVRARARIVEQFAPHHSRGKEQRCGNE